MSRDPTRTKSTLGDFDRVVSNLNAVGYVDHARLDLGEREDGERLPLSGFSLVVKDNIDVAGMPTTAGTPALAGHFADQSATAVKRLEAAGANVVAKSNMHELAYGITSNNAFSGAVKNPYDLNAIAGGSSGGTAAAVAGRAVRAGLGTDTGGSSRIPAALCGVCGFRPTTGRYPSDGVLQISRTRDTIGPIATSIADIQLLDQVLANVLCATPEVDIATLTVGIARDSLLGDLEPDVAEVMEATLATLESCGVEIVDIDAAAIFALNDRVGFPVVLYETPQDVAAYLRDNNIDLTFAELVAAVASPDVSGVLQQTIGEQAIPLAAYQAALFTHRPALQSAFATLFSQSSLDAIAYPTTPLTAKPIGQDDTVCLNGREAPAFPTYIRNCDPSANAGIPSVSLPMGLSGEGLPIGLSLDGPMASDSRLLAIAHAFEQVLPKIPLPTPSTTRQSSIR